MSKIQVNCVETRNLFYTHGMAEYGLPELEIRNVPLFLGEAASDILRRMCNFMLDSLPPIELDEYLSLDGVKTVFTFRKAVPIPGEEQHYHVERWELIGVYDLVREEIVRERIAESISKRDMSDFTPEEQEGIIEDAYKFLRGWYL